MKFTPLPSTSPRVIHTEPAFGDPPIRLEVIWDPVKLQRVLSIGIGDKMVRRTWLSERDTAILISKITKVWSS